MTDIDEKQMPLDEVGVVGPGNALQKARMEKNLRPEDVAYEIRLTPSQVLALEDDDYSKMPESTYVRGYLRNYARLVGLPESDVMLAYARLTRSEDRQTHHVIPRGEKQIDNGGRGLRITAGLLLVVLVVVSALWFYYQQPGETPAQQEQVAEQQAAEPELPAGTSTLRLSAPQQTESSGSEAVASDSSDGEQVATPAETTTAGATEQPLPEPATQTVPLPELVTEPVAVVTEPPADVQPAPVTAEAEPAVADSAAVAGQGRLIITYSKDSWTDIRDANGEKLLYRTVKAGQTVAIAGQVPLSLFFGFAQGVSVNFNGRDVDLAPYTRGVFARLTLGESNR